MAIILQTVTYSKYKKYINNGYKKHHTLVADFSNFYM